MKAAGEHIAGSAGDQPGDSQALAENALPAGATAHASVPVSAPSSSESAAIINRRHHRHPTKQPGTLYELVKGTQTCNGVPCVVTDLCGAGVGVKCRRMIPAGRSVFVKIEKAGMPAKLLFGVVRQCRYEDRGMHHMGVQLQVTPDSPALRKRLLGSDHA